MLTLLLMTLVRYEASTKRAISAISRGIALHRSARSMAGLLGRCPSTVSREISRNGGYDGYRAAGADERAWPRARRPKRYRDRTSSEPGSRNDFTVSENVRDRHAAVDIRPI